MKAKDVALAQGVRWVLHGVQLASRQPLGYMGLLGLMLSVALLLFMLPIVGVLVLLGLMPMAWLIFMLGSRMVLQGQRIHPLPIIRHVAQSLQAPGRKRNWAILGLIYIGVNLLAMGVAGLLGPDMAMVVERMQANAKAPPEDVLNDPVLLESMAWRMALLWPVSLLFWHTPALLHWGGASPVKAIFMSAVICWRNLGAFLGYGLGWVALVAAAAVPTQVAAMLLGPGLLLQLLSMTLGL